MLHPPLAQPKGRVRPYWALQLGAWLAFGVAMGIGRIGEMPGIAIVLIDGPFALLGWLVTLGLYRWYRVTRAPETSTVRAIALVALSSWIAAMVWTAVFHQYLHAVAVPTVAALEPGVVLPVRRGPMLDNTVYNTLTLVAWSTLYLGLVYRDQLQDQRDRALRAMAEAKDAQLRMLAYQLNPHFLFNTLTSLRALIDEDRGRARQMVSELARFLRYALEERPLHLAPLAEELAAVRGYLAIEAVRFEDRLDVRVDVDEDAARCRVPAFILNPLVENAIRHGDAAGPTGALRLHIRGRAVGKVLELVVENSGTLTQRPSVMGRQGIGLRNVRDRLAHHYPDAHRFLLEERDGVVYASVSIPASYGDGTDATSTHQLLRPDAHAP